MSARHGRRRLTAMPRWNAGPRARVGDQIIVNAASPDRASREGLIVEVQNGNGAPPYVVIWSDNGERALLYPGGDTLIQRVAQSA